MSDGGRERERGESCLLKEEEKRRRGENKVSCSRELDCQLGNCIFLSISIAAGFIALRRALISASAVNYCE
jgi:hypothetical protein